MVTTQQLTLISKKMFLYMHFFFSHFLEAFQ
jgi:hypothetical protein